MDHDFTTTVFVTEEGRPQRRLRSAKRHLLSTRRLPQRLPPRAPRCDASLSLFTPLLSRSGRAMDSRADSVWTLNTPPSHFPSSVSSPRSQFASSLHDHRQNPARGPGGRIHARIRSGHRTHRPVPRRRSTCVVFMHLRHITGLFSGHSVPPADLRQQHKGYNTRTGLVPLNGFRPPSRRPHA